MKKHITLILLTVVCTSAFAQSQYRYWFDGQTDKVQSGSAQSSLRLTADVASLDNGLHTLYLAVTNRQGQPASLRSALFMKSDTSSGSYRLWIDDNEEAAQTGTLQAIQQVTIDVSALADGLHTLYYALTDADGSTSQSAALFLKSPAESSIVGYKYYVNNSDEPYGAETFAQPANPYHLLQQLDVPSLPLRSQCFWFEMPEDEQPVVYALNDLDLRFFDDNGRFVRAIVQYADPTVCEPVVAELLTSGETKESAAPEENHINWYKAEAQTGDSLLFTTTGGGTMQLFAPDGTMLADSTEGILKLKVAQMGMFYLAVHDLTTGEPWLNVYFERTASTEGIDTVNADSSRLATTFSIDGRTTQTPAKGVYIIGGKKFFIR